MILSHLNYEYDRALLNELITKENLEDLDIDWRIILKCSFNKYVSMD